MPQLCIEKMVEHVPALTLRPLVKNCYHKILKAHSQDGRHYHSISHLESMLGLLAEAAMLTTETYWATCFHDFVYRPTHANNEDESAWIANLELTKLGIGQETIVAVVDMILAT